MRRQVVPAAWAAFVLSGCAGDSAVQRVQKTDSANIEIIQNPGTDRLLDRRFQRVFTLGGADAGPQSFFRVYPAGLRFDGRGRLHVLDAGNKRVLVFDSTGALLRTIGRQGAGPGEFENPAALFITSDGSVHVVDAGHQAISRFDSAGAFTGRLPLPHQFAGGVVRPDETAIVYPARVRAPDSGASHLGVRRAEGADTVQVFQVRLPDYVQVTYEECGVSIPLPPLFAEQPQWDARGSRVVLGDVPTYSVRVFDQGIEARHVRRPIAPEPASPERARQQLGGGETWFFNGRECTVPPDRAIEKRGLATHIPVIARVAVAPGDELWVMRRIVGETVGPINVFNAAGLYTGTLPAGTPWPADFGTTRRIVTLETDELDVQRVVVYRQTR